MSDSFLDIVEPYILSDDSLLRDFALDSIKSARIGSEETFHYILEALDKVEPNAMVNRVLPYASNISITESMLKELLKRIKLDDDNQIWYISLLSNCDFDLMVKYQEDIAPFVNKDYLESVVSLYSMDSVQLFSEIDDIVHSLGADYFNQPLFKMGKKIYKELIRRGEITDSYIQGIDASIKKESKKEFITYEGIYKIYLAGELENTTSILPTLAGLLLRGNEEVLLEVVTETIIKIGSPEIFPLIEKYISHEQTFYEAIDILKNIKDPRAEEILLHHFDLVTNITAKTLIADSLCYQLSKKSITKVGQLVEDGYDSGVLDLKESLYANCMINGIEHPKLPKWKDEISQKYNDLSPMITTIQPKKVGRNEPCSCGSGKKYKKCCGK
ncbi:SEC-C metal-binding domain-containing protein [Oceanobacillus sp. CAU 1775]